MTGRASSRAAALAAGIALTAIGCGGSTGGPPDLDGVYRVTTSANDLAAIEAPGERAAYWGTWTLVLHHGRFAVTQDGDQACAWAYGALRLGRGNQMSWRVIDAGALPAGAAANEPNDRYRFTWSRYRDVLTLTPSTSGAAGYFAARPWRRIAQTPTARELSPRCPPPAGALEPTGAEHAVPAHDASFHLAGDLARSGRTTWTGVGTAKQFGRGRLTLDGDVAFGRAETRGRATFAARFVRGTVRGCVVDTVLPRPHGRYLWGGTGQITGASPALRRYVGLEVDLNGVTMAGALARMYGSLDSPPPARPTPQPGDLC